MKADANKETDYKFKGSEPQGHELDHQSLMTEVSSKVDDWTRKQKYFAGMPGVRSRIIKIESAAVRIAGFRRLKNKRCSRAANNQLLPDFLLSLVYPSEERLNIVVIEELFNSMKVGGIM